MEKTLNYKQLTAVILVEFSPSSAAKRHCMNQGSRDPAPEALMPGGGRGASYRYKEDGLAVAAQHRPIFYSSHHIQQLGGSDRTMPIVPEQH
jgi:hypothetical protein